jgi:SOS-response transcriptional repressor LexA
MTQNTLTARQAEILELIRSYIAEEGCPPTRAEIAETLGFRFVPRMPRKTISAHWSARE